MSNQDILHLLLGEWWGSGKGEFPTIEPFEYLETISFSSDGRPFLHYDQKTRRRRSGQTEYAPSHWESGFIRMPSDGQVEVTCAQNGGRLEMLRGSLESTETGLILRLQSTAFLNDPRMLETSRIITLEGDTLHYTQTMHTTAVKASTHHVEARLNRIS